MLKINDTRKVADLIVAELNKRGAGLGNAAAFCVMQTLDELEAAQPRVHPTNGGLVLRACVNANCGWVGKESACLTWKHEGDERMCPYCHDNTESIPLSAISG